MTIVPTFVKNFLRRSMSSQRTATGADAAANDLVQQTNRNPAHAISTPAPHPARAMFAPPKSAKRDATPTGAVWTRARPAFLEALAVPDRAAQASLFANIQRNITTSCKNTRSEPLDAAIDALIDAARGLPPRGLRTLYYDVFLPVLGELGSVTRGDVDAMERFQRDFDLNHRAFWLVQVDGKPLSYEDYMFGIAEYSKHNLVSQIFGWVYLAERRKASAEDSDQQPRKAAVERCLQWCQEPWGQFSTEDFLAAL